MDFQEGYMMKKIIIEILATRANKRLITNIASWNISAHFSALTNMGCTKSDKLCAQHHDIYVFQYLKQAGAVLIVILIAKITRENIIFHLSAVGNGSWQPF